MLSVVELHSEKSSAPSTHMKITKTQLLLLNAEQAEFS